jgi:hypothetical protein
LKRAEVKRFFKEKARFATLLRKALAEKNAPQNPSNNPLMPSSIYLLDLF